MKPYLLLDVDGVLNPLWTMNAKESDGWERHRITSEQTNETYTVMLNPSLHRPMIEELQENFEVVWATTWDWEANDKIGPRLGLEELPVVPNCATRKRLDWSLYPKTTAVLNWAEKHPERPFVWFDDQVSKYDQFFLERRSLTCLLVTVDGARGLLPEHVSAARFWTTTGWEALK